MNEPVTSTQDIERLTAKRRWEQIGAAGGIAYVVLQLASQVLIQAGGSEPAFNAPAEEIADFFLNRNLSLTPIAGFLTILSIIAFLWFLGVLWAALQRHEGEPSWLSLVAFGSGVAGMAILLSSSGWELAVLRLGDGQSAETGQLLFDQGNFAFASLWVAISSMLLATGVVAIRDGALPRWLGWFGLILALGMLLARYAWFTASGIKFMPYSLFWLWLIAASIVLIRRARSYAPEEQG